jgi:hypothetical protein
MIFFMNLLFCVCVCVCLAEHYGVESLELEHSTYDSSVSCLEALYNGEGDLAGPFFTADAPFYLGTNVRYPQLPPTIIFSQVTMQSFLQAPINRQVVFDASCAWADSIASFVVLDGGNITSFADLQVPSKSTAIFSF